MRRLPLRYRQVLVLYYGADLSSGRRRGRRLVLAQGPLGRRATPLPPVTQPTRPSSPFVQDVRVDYSHLTDLEVVELADGRLNGFDWHLAAVRGTTPTGGQARVCLVQQREAANQGGTSRDCADQTARRSAKMVARPGPVRHQSAVG
jgi:hypothetical protein